MELVFGREGSTAGTGKIIHCPFEFSQNIPFILTFSKCFKVCFQCVKAHKCPHAELQEHSGWRSLTCCFPYFSCSKTFAQGHLYSLLIKSFPIRLFIDLKIINIWFREVFLNRAGIKVCVFMETNVNSGRNTSLNPAPGALFFALFVSQVGWFSFCFFPGHCYLCSLFYLAASDPAGKGLNAFTFSSPQTCLGCLS